MATAFLEGRRIHIRGTVQGVGFRPWVYRTARMAGISGRVWNDAAGVTIDAFGDEAALEQFIDALHFPPPAARILALAESRIDAESASAFEIVPSAVSADRHVSIPPDLATCGECLAEMRDPSNRRYRYPFTNCTNCGPRFTIATDIPYDRAATTMAPFEMCDACRREYEDVGDRRFHAQPNACRACGPTLTLYTHDGVRIHADDVIAAAAQALAEGFIVAIKGIGGFHLACDATSETAVQRLRQRKHRDEKPLAVMLDTLESAEAIAVVGEEERRLLTSAARPIVLLPARKGSPLAASIAPRNRMVGLFLPYAPLHHLLLADAGRPLVMTSGNLSDEPIAYRNDEALRRLGGVADLFLLHDREIETRTDDSVVAVIGGRGAVLRRSRGYVPRAIQLARDMARPVLACGALLKNTFCLASGTDAWFGPHIGDLENLETYESYTSAIARMERFLQIRPDVVAYDLHPDYMSSSYARQREGVIHVPVQHHHAHVVSAMAEHGIPGPAIGIAYDGTGYGTDGTMWGGEVIVATAAAFQRVATFRPIRMAGGDRATRAPWRLALALVLDVFGEVPMDARPLFDVTPERERTALAALLRCGMEIPLVRGVGRYFDAFGALFLRRTRASFEGQIATEWNQVADPAVCRAYRFGLRSDPIIEIDLGPTLRDALSDYAAGEPVSAIAAAFHNTIAEATAMVVKQAVRQHGALPIVASGGCFQNPRLAESIRAALAPEHDVRLHHDVPPGDGGIALGQAVVADAMVRG